MALNGDRRERWESHDAGLALLDAAGPFEHRHFREVLVAAEGWRDLSYAACLPDGTQAAIALLARRGVGVSVPWGYGAVRSTRPLDPVEVDRFVQSARRHHGLVRVVVREVGEPTLTPARTVATTHVLTLDPEKSPRSSFTGSTRNKINRARRDGLTAHPTADASAFLELYAEATKGWGSGYYPSEAIHALTACGIARCYDVRYDGEVISSTLAIMGADHWMYWLAASSADGRRWQGGYFALAALIDDAWACGAPAVNLGASEVDGRALPGVAEFKQRFGGVRVPFSRASRAVPGIEPLLRAGAPVRRRLSARRHGRDGDGAASTVTVSGGELR